jgi:hypothetical protein
MKWRILLELTGTTGSVQTREMVTGDRPTNVISPESIGLSLAESKSILAAIQTHSWFKPRPMDIVIIAGNVRIAARGAPSKTGALAN